MKVRLAFPKGKIVELTLQEPAVFEYLVELRDSGVTNMFGAVPYIQKEFGCSEQEARYWLIEWIKSFKKEPEYLPYSEKERKEDYKEEKLPYSDKKKI